MNITAQTPARSYYVRNTITGAFWDGSAFNATAPDGTAQLVPADALPIIRATWENTEAVPTDCVQSKTGAKEATRAVSRAVERNQQERQQEQRRQQAAARRQKQNDEGAAYIARLTATALAMAASQPATDDQAARRLASQQQHVAEAWLGAREALTERAERMAYDPAGYFEWADTDMDNAATVELYGRIIHGVADGKPFAELHAAAVGYLTRALLNNTHRANSTSASHNAMEEARRNAASRFVEHASWQ